MPQQVEVLLSHQVGIFSDGLLFTTFYSYPKMVINRSCWCGKVISYELEKKIRKKKGPLVTSEMEEKGVAVSRTVTPLTAQVSSCQGSLSTVPLLLQHVCTL